MKNKRKKAVMEIIRIRLFWRGSDAKHLFCTETYSKDNKGEVCVRCIVFWRWTRFYYTFFVAMSFLSRKILSV